VSIAEAVAPKNVQSDALTPKKMELRGSSPSSAKDNPVL
jgi:hypothetical protein